MKKLPIILLFFTHAAYAQVDSLTHAPDSLTAAVNHKLDSIEGSFNQQVDSLKQSYGQAKSGIESLKTGYQKRIDSLNSLSLPTEKYTAKVDSLNNRLAGVQQKTSAKIDSLKGQVTAKIKSLNLPPQADDKISKLTASVDKLNLPSMDADISNKMGLGNLHAAIPELPVAGLNTNGLPSVDLPSTSTALPSVSTPPVNVQDNLDQVNQVTGKAGEIKQQLKEGVSAEQVGQAIENKASQLDQVKAIQDQAMPGMPEGLPAEMPASGEEAKEQLVTLAQTAAVNHFAGKEEQLQAAMKDISKFKQKYSDVQSIKDLPKKAPNPMKGKPFIERIIPGVAFQILYKNDWSLDVGPYVGYRFNGRINAGLGWNQRFAFTGDSEFNKQARVYGPRAFGEFEITEGIAARLELETMNTFVPPLLKQTTSPTEGHREWVPAIIAGFKKDYKIYKRLSGTALLLYNFYNPEYKSPYGDRVIARFGLEYSLKKKKKGNS